MTGTKDGRIRELDPGLRAVIAAGEVVERPASLLKELVENSLDAGAGRIDAAIEAGGLELVRVQDDGAGIHPDDLPLALARHATSKIASWSDLEEAETFGFRGEALASAAAVSDLTVESRREGEPEARIVHSVFGRMDEPRPSSLHRGTVVEARSLFANVPARLKFLKGPGAEARRCRDWLFRLALAHLGVEFRLSCGGRDDLAFLAGQTLRERLCAMWQGSAVDSLLDFEGEADGVRAHGVCSAPSAAQTNESRILVYANGRPVQNRRLIDAVREGYAGRLTGRERPQAVVFVEVGQKELDANAHPAKLEVRFQREAEVFSCIADAIRPALDAAGCRVFAAKAPSFMLADADASGAESPFRTPDAGSFFRDAGAAPAPFGGQPAAAPARPSAPASGNADGGLFGIPAPFRAQAAQDAGEEVVPFPAMPELRKEGAPAAPQASPFAEAEPSAASPFMDKGMPFSAGEEAGMRKPMLAGGLEYLGQIAGTYLVLRGEGDSLLLLDQHAAHERILFSRIMSKVKKETAKPLLLPIEIPLHPAEAERWRAGAERLRELGFHGSLEGMALSVAAVPHALDRKEAEAFLREFLAGCRDDLHEMLARAACRGAVKAGRKLLPGEALKLVEEWLETPDKEWCPHGRPTALRWDGDALARLFKRR